MRPVTLVALSALMLGVAACATAPAAPLEVASSGAPVPTEGYDWFFHEDGDDATLAYGVEESDDLRLGLDCSKGSGRLDLSASMATGTPAEIHIESGGDTERYPAKAEPSEIHEGVFLTAEARTSDPVFQRFRQVGWVALWQGQEREAYAPQSGSADRVGRFFAFCG